MPGLKIINGKRTTRPRYCGLDILEWGLVLSLAAIAVAAVLIFFWPITTLFK